MTLEKRTAIIELFDIYSSLLTDKQREYFTQYYFDDLSISEIAENLNVSRNAVFDQVKRVVAILKDYEEKMGLVAKIKEIEGLEEKKNFKEVVLEILRK